MGHAEVGVYEFADPGLDGLHAGGDEDGADIGVE